jgi:hypothetical protein
VLVPKTLDLIFEAKFLMLQFHSLQSSEDLCVNVS